MAAYRHWDRRMQDPFLVYPKRFHCCHSDQLQNLETMPDARADRRTPILAWESVAVVGSAAVEMEVVEKRFRRKCILPRPPGPCTCPYSRSRYRRASCFLLNLLRNTWRVSRARRPGTYTPAHNSLTERP